MKFWLQNSNESNALNIEIQELVDVIKDQRNNGILAHEYEFIKSDYFSRYEKLLIWEDWMRDYTVPVGSIQFVQKYLKEFYDIDHMNPIEVPECLRLPHLLLRDYKIVPYEQIPRNGNYFVKDVSQLKSWTYSGSMTHLFSKSFNQKLIDTSHLFQVSGILDIMAEYRVIVRDTQIIGIQFYDGKPTIMPTPREINKIQEMVARYSMAKDRAIAYTMDVAIVKTKDGEGRDLAIIEIHPFVAAGTYGCRGDFLPALYQIGIRWYIDHNTPIHPTK
jgi:hypothetical protein